MVIFYSVAQALFGSGIGPVTINQMFISILINLVGSIYMGILLATIVDYCQAYSLEQTQFQQKVLDLKYNLRKNEVTHSLRDRVMDYFYYQS